ncbi:elongation factor Ts [Candidatus Uhrbacteria bacterium CG10_big_fil_rev_8_21_14_0_10_48_11]|uniref:Elongation factor Ts n=1 Tax=Candidatus Uhrbacteria bacterium CG10_big_fil_rev_8_21_14_0_10_48_11 TaxID=1975037 RepID=A0A2M8LDW1_9BACT|nr:MAG: elongation factor Ts [Candidatus Uhrbacteria bacterium CG10_big_fil_rev_8_21_14_0_10_48_11]
MTKETIVALRRETGAGISDIHKALEEAGGDQAKALELLKKRGQAKALKKQDRETSEGIVHAYVHGNGRVGVLIEVACETDFVARNEDFQSFVHDIALQVAATNPRYLSVEDIPEEVKAKELSLAKERLEEEGKLAGKDATIIDKILEGSFAKFVEAEALLAQSSIKEESQTIKDLLVAITAKVGENVQIKRFTRYEIGQ